MSKPSRGKFHHVDSTVTCPDCGRRFRTGTVVAEGPAGDLREPLENTGPRRGAPEGSGPRSAAGAHRRG